MTDAVFTDLRRATLAALVDTLVAPAAHDGERPRGLSAGSDARLAVQEHLATELPAEHLAGILQLIDTFALVGLKNQPQHIREVSVDVVVGISPEIAAGVGAIQQLATAFADAATDQ